MTACHATPRIGPRAGRLLPLLAALAGIGAGAGPASGQVAPVPRPAPEAVLVEGDDELRTFTPRPMPPRQLRVMVLDLTEAGALRAVPGEEPPAPAALYRHTFGAERRTSERAPPAATVDPALLEADVVLLQGLVSVRATRRLLPAREWRLVLARHRPDADEADRPADRMAAAKVEGTAIAVRLRHGLRVVGQLQPHQTGGVGTAARVLVSGSPLWLLSAGPGPDCPASAACPAADAHARGLDAFFAARREAGEQAIIGGPLPPQTAAPPFPAAHGLGGPAPKAVVAPRMPAPPVVAAPPPPSPLAEIRGALRLPVATSAGLAQFPGPPDRRQCPGGAAIRADLGAPTSAAPATHGHVIVLGAASAANPREPLPMPSLRACVLLLDFAG